MGGVKFSDEAFGHKHGDDLEIALDRKSKDARYLVDLKESL